MAHALNASILLARAVGLVKRAQHLAERAPDPFVRAKSAAVQLDAWNIRTLLSDTLRGSIPGAASVEELEGRLRADAEQLGALEDRLRLSSPARP
jgi:hypothetical protein